MAALWAPAESGRENGGEGWAGGRGTGVGASQGRGLLEGRRPPRGSSRAGGTQSTPSPRPLFPPRKLEDGPAVVESGGGVHMEPHFGCLLSAKVVPAQKAKGV